MLCFCHDFSMIFVIFTKACHVFTFFAVIFYFLLTQWLLCFRYICSLMSLWTVFTRVVICFNCLIIPASSVPAYRLCMMVLCLFTVIIYSTRVLMLQLCSSVIDPTCKLVVMVVHQVIRHLSGLRSLVLSLTPRLLQVVVSLNLVVHPWMVSHRNLLCCSFRCRIFWHNTWQCCRHGWVVQATDSWLCRSVDILLRLIWLLVDSLN